MSSACVSCGTQLAPILLACPACQRLVHADRLRTLAAEAQAASAGGNPGAALLAWRTARDLLPPQSRQYAQVVEHIETLSRTESPVATTPTEPRGPLARIFGLGGAAVILLLTKGKFLLSGLLKLPTLLSMLAAAGVYWSLWGWKFAFGLVLTTYVHEMGHVAALIRYGIPASPPMFVPGLGAYVRLHRGPDNQRQNARVGLAGPLWGFAAGVVCLGIGRLTGGAGWLAIAQFTGFVNLFNLLPFWQLDGGRAFASLTRTHRMAALVLIGVAWWTTHEGLLVLLMLGAGWQLFQPAPEEEDLGALVYFGILVGLLSALTALQVPTVSGS